MAEPQTPVPEEAVPPGAASRVRRAIVVGGRVATGIAGLAVAGIAGLAAFVPWPVVGAVPPAIEISPAAAELVQVCPGGALRFGTETGEDAGTAYPVGEPTVRADAVGGTPSRAEVAGGAFGAPGGEPVVLRLPPSDGAQLAGAQSQAAATPDIAGLAAVACAEPSGSVWLVGGAGATGRTTVLTLANPTEVPATVTLTIHGERGPVSAPGLAGIQVPAGSRVALSLAGFAPDVRMPVVHVESRGGHVVAALQHTVVRGLDPVGFELTGASPDPADRLVIPGVRVLDATGVARALALADWEDAAPVIRIAVPGDADATVRVTVVPEIPVAPHDEHDTDAPDGDADAEGGDGADGEGAEEPLAGAGFEAVVAAGTVAEFPLEAETEPGHMLVDGIYTVLVEADAPVLAAVRVTTAVDRGGDELEPDAAVHGPPSDLAWFTAAPALDGDRLVVVAPGPDPVVTVANPGDADATVVLEGPGGPVTLAVPAGASASVAVAPGGHLVRGAAGLHLAVSYAAPAQLAGYTVAPPRPTDAPILIRPAG